MTPAQQARAAVLEFVRANPGADPAGIRARLGLSPQDCANAIKRLKGKLWRVGQPMLWRYFACPNAAQDAKAAVEAELRQRRLDRAQRNNESKARRRRAGSSASRPSGPSTKQRMRAWIAQHEGCAYRDIAAGLQLGKGQMDKALYQLIQRGDVIAIGPRGNMRYATTLESAAAIDVDALLAQRTQILAQRIAGVTPPRKAKATSQELAERARRKNELRQKRLQARREERDRLAVARLQNEQRQAVAGVAKPKPPKRQQERVPTQAPQARPQQVVVAKPAGQPLVTVKSTAEAWRQAEAIVPPGVKKIVCPSAPDRWAADVQRNRGAISQDWFARRQGEPIPSRLNGAYK